MVVYEISESEFNALQALGNFSDNAFCGYAQEHGAEEEQEVATRFAWLVESYAKLLAVSAKKKEE